jgi:hypothetical protein
MNDGMVIRTEQLSARVGVSYRRLDRWCRMGVLRFSTEKPRAGRPGPMPGSGSRRLFSPQEQRVTAFVLRLSDLGADTAVLWVAAGNVRARQSWHGFVAVTPDGALHDQPYAGFEAGWVVDLAACDAVVARAA